MGGLFFHMKKKNILEQRGELFVRLNALPVVLLCEEFDLKDQGQHGPGGFFQDGCCNRIRLMQKSVTLWHSSGQHWLNPTKQLLMFQFLITETDQGFECYLVTQPMTPC